MAIPVPSQEYSLNIDSFTVFISSRGAEILPSKGEWEILRYRAHDKINILYRSKKGITWTKDIAEAWRAFRQDKDWNGDNSIPPKRTHELIVSLIHRDAVACFYCGVNLKQEEMHQEMLLERQHGGVQHMSNLVLTHATCSKEASGLPIMRKIELREKNLTSKRTYSRK